MEKLYGVRNKKTGALVSSGRNYTPAVYDNLGKAKSLYSRNSYGIFEGNYEIVELNVVNIIPYEKKK